MVIALGITGAVILFFSNFFKTWRRTKLSQIDLIEYNKTIQPQATKYLLIVSMPIFLVVIFVFTGLTIDIILFISLFAVVQIGLYIYCYSKVKKIINASNNPSAYNFVTAYLIVNGIGTIALISAMFYLFLMPGPY